eukprot:CAMPEP_0195519116 /NCGR_PEP_ID=MMETSP0794_2-20130614/14399_1 /TAXON_ID=515487 /ORGANISM="Stephanopyxis turris, Strain CCMP 815" /LENGTH=340 /DNA_ID=CAMNT_0040648223 /DNA_START=203 /DNA_END=1225 /DNA_ORIENTATION=+
MRFTCLAAIVALSDWTAPTEARTILSTPKAPLSGFQSSVPPATLSSSSLLNDAILELRGGASRGKMPKKKGRMGSLHSNSSNLSATGKTKVKGNKGSEQKSAVSDTMQKYKSILPLTRVYITMVGIVTLIGVVLGDEAAQGLLALDPMRVMYGLELWRPFTAATFLGPPSVGWLMSGYYLFEYGSNLESAYGTAQHVLFLLCQIVLLSLLSVLFGQPFFGASVITAMLHVLSRSMPDQKVKWLIFTVPYWSLPLGLMATDVLQAGSPAAALPHVMGILTGHVYFFHKFVWPKMGGEDWLTAPDFLVRRLDPNSRLAMEAKAANNALKKSRKKGSGRKLGR